MNTPSSPEPDSSFLTPQEVAERYRVSSRTVLNWVERKEIPAIRIGKVIRFRESDVVEAIEGKHTRSSGCQRNE